MSEKFIPLSAEEKSTIASNETISTALPTTSLVAEAIVISQINDEKGNVIYVNQTPKENKLQPKQPEKPMESIEDWRLMGESFIKQKISEQIIEWNEIFNDNTASLIRARLFSVLNLYFTQLSALKINLLTGLNKGFLNRFLNTNKIEIPINSISIPVLLKVSAIFDINLHWLLTGKGDAVKYNPELHLKLYTYENYLNAEYDKHKIRMLTPTRHIVKPLPAELVEQTCVNKNSQVPNDK